MKKTARRFETVPLARVLKKTIVVEGDPKVEKMTTKDEPYSLAQVVRSAARVRERQ